MPRNAKDLDKFIGNKIRFFRKQRGWGLKTLAMKLDISIQQLQKYEIGLNKISASTLYDLIKIFNLSVDTFFESFENNQTYKNNNKAFSLHLLQQTTYSF